MKSPFSAPREIPDIRPSPPPPQKSYRVGMITYCYIRTSKARDAGVIDRNIFADVGVSGAAGVKTRNQWHALDQRLGQDDVLVVAAVDRIGRRFLDTMWAIYDLHRRGVRIRSLADNEGQWTAYLDADPDSPEAFLGKILASLCAYVASQERQSISRRIKEGLETARAKGKQLGRPRRVTDEQLEAMRQDKAMNMTIMAIARKYGIPESTVRSYLSDTQLN